MNRTLEDVWREQCRFIAPNHTQNFNIPKTSYNVLVRYFNIAVRLTAKLEDLYQDSHHNQLMLEAYARGYRTYPTNILKGDAALLQRIIAQTGFFEPFQGGSNEVVKIPPDQLFNVFSSMDAAFITTDKMKNLFRTTDYLKILRQARKEGRPYTGTNTLSEFVTIRWGQSMVENRLKQDMNFQKSESSWTASARKYIAS